MGENVADYPRKAGPYRSFFAPPGLGDIVGWRDDPTDQSRIELGRVLTRHGDTLEIEDAHTGHLLTMEVHDLAEIYRKDHSV